MAMSLVDLLAIMYTIGTFEGSGGQLILYEILGR